MILNLERPLGKIELDHCAKLPISPRLQFELTSISSNVFER